jgi:uncharacterized membrane protein
MIWRKYGKDDPIIEAIDFYPPEGLNSAETAFWYNGKARSTDIVSLLIYLANKGYLQICENEAASSVNINNSFFKTKGFIITKIKEYDGDNENEKTFITELFNNTLNENTVTNTELQNRFYITLNKITLNMNKKENKAKVIEKDSKSKNIWGILMIYAVYFLITVKPVLEHGDAKFLIIAMVFSGIGFTLLFASIFFIKERINLFLILWGAFFGGIPWSFTVLPSILAEPVYIISYCFGFACIIAILFLMKIMPKRTPLGRDRLGKIKGFRKFLELAEKPKLEELVSHNPEYFYNILPFTYVLGVSDKWVKKFETIVLQPPNWYSGRTSFSNASFGSFMRSTMTSASNAMRSSPSSGSGSSGGGSSGSGSGGGGGRSW